jgi:hypothetical protein
MMNGYSKIGSSTTSTTTHKSTRSIDFFSFPQPQTPKPIRNLPPTTPRIEEPNINNHNEQETPQTQREDQGERFGVILGRSSSVSNYSSSSSASGFQATMKRTFSVRRSSSVTDRYCRIHDQSMAIASDELDDDDNNINMMNDSTVKNKTNSNRGRRGKILKACKRLFGLSS